MAVLFGMYVLHQFQVVLLDPAGLPQDVAEEPGQDSGQDEADEDQADPVKCGDGSLGACLDVSQPAGVDADLTRCPCRKRPLRRPWSA